MYPPYAPYPANGPGLNNFKGFWNADAKLEAVMRLRSPTTALVDHNIIISDMIGLFSPDMSLKRPVEEWDVRELWKVFHFERFEQCPLGRRRIEIRDCLLVIFNYFQLDDVPAIWEFIFNCIEFYINHRLCDDLIVVIAFYQSQSESFCRRLLETWPEKITERRIVLDPDFFDPNSVVAFEYLHGRGESMRLNKIAWRTTSQKLFMYLTKITELVQRDIWSKVAYGPRDFRFVVDRTHWIRLNIPGLIDDGYLMEMLFRVIDHSGVIDYLHNHCGKVGRAMIEKRVFEGNYWTVWDLSPSKMKFMARAYFLGYKVDEACMLKLNHDLIDWSPRTHRFSHPDVRKWIFTVLLVIRRVSPAMPRDIRLYILSLITGPYATNFVYGEVTFNMQYIHNRESIRYRLGYPQEQARPGRHLEILPGHRFD